jgi:hypothetical protein
LHFHLNYLGCHCCRNMQDTQKPEINPSYIADF